MVRLSLHSDVVMMLNVRMKEIGLSQVELAKRMGWTPKHVNRILGGHAEPSLASLDFMAFLLGIEFDVRVKVR